MCHIATLMYGLGLEMRGIGLGLGKKVLFTSLPYNYITALFAFHNRLRKLIKILKIQFTTEKLY